MSVRTGVAPGAGSGGLLATSRAEREEPGRDEGNRG